MGKALVFLGLLADFITPKDKTYGPAGAENRYRCYVQFFSEIYKSTIYSKYTIAFNYILCYLCIIKQLVCFIISQIYIKAHYIVKNI